MDRNIEKLEPQSVWKYFKNITQIPRPSKKEAKILAYLIEEAKRLQLDYLVTPIGNIVIRKKPTDSTPCRKKIALQAHMDMVPSKTKESKHNFEKDPIDAYIDGEWVTANQTTLGADNGMGIAMALAVLSSADIKHHDLEVLITTDKEAGMSGAFGVIGDELQSEVLLNLDSEDDSEVCIGCAGGINTNISYPYTKVEAKTDALTFKIELKDLFSGHSGVDIPLGRANAIKEIAHLLIQLHNEFNIDLVSISGGKLRNVIPSYCEAVITSTNYEPQKIIDFVNNYAKDLTQEFAETDPNLKLTIQKISPATQIIAPHNALHFINALASVFNGVWRMNNKLGIAETSSNVGVVSTTDTHLELVTLQRSAMHAPKIKAANSVAAAFRQIGADIEHSDSYPGWQPNTESPALAVVKQVYKELFNHEIHVGATHGGLECGLIMDKFPSLDAISIGATIRFPHSPNEKVNIQSVAKSWHLLSKLIEAL
jgi:dipeptidase D